MTVGELIKQLCNLQSPDLPVYQWDETDIKSIYADAYGAYLQ